MKLKYDMKFNTRILYENNININENNINISDDIIINISDNIIKPLRIKINKNQN